MPKRRSSAPQGNSLLAHIVTASLDYQDLSGLERLSADGVHVVHDGLSDVAGRAHEIHGSAALLDSILLGPVVTRVGLSEDVPGQRAAVSQLTKLGPTLGSSARAVSKGIEQVIAAPSEEIRQAAVEQLATNIATLRDTRDAMRIATDVIGAPGSPLGFSLRHPVTTAINGQYLDWLEMATRADVNAKPTEDWVALAKKARQVLGNAETLTAILDGPLVQALALRNDVPGQRNAVSRMAKLAPVLSSHARVVAESIEQIATAPNKTRKLRAVRQLAASFKAFKATRDEIWTYAKVFEPAAMNGLEREDPEKARALRRGTYRGGFKAVRPTAAKPRAKAPARVSPRPAAAQVTA